MKWRIFMNEEMLEKEDIATIEFEKTRQELNKKYGIELPDSETISKNIAKYCSEPDDGSPLN